MAVNKNIESIASKAGIEFDNYNMAWDKNIKDHNKEGIDLNLFATILIEKICFMIEYGGCWKTPSGSRILTRNELTTMIKEYFEVVPK